MTISERKLIFQLSLFIAVAVFLILGFVLSPFYLSLGLGLIIIFSLLAVRLEWGIYLIAALFPFINLQIFIGKSFNVPYVDLVAMAVFAAWLIKLFWDWANTGRFIKLKDLPGIFFFLLFIGASLLSLYNSQNVLQSLKFVLRPLAFFYLMFVIVPYNIIKDFKALKNIIRIMFGVGILVSLMGLASLFVVKGLTFTRIVPIKIFGIYPLGANQNLIAETLIAIIPLTGVLIALARKEINKKLLILSMAFMAVITLGTLSRAGWICLILAGLIFLFAKYRQHLKTIIPLAVLIIILTLPLTYYMTQLVRSDVSRSANENRLLLTEIAWENFKRHPIIGSGAGIYINLVAADRWYIYNFGHPLDSHGVVQKLLAESGVIGLLTFLLLIGYILNHLLKSYKKLPAGGIERDIMLAFIITVVISLVFQIFNTSYYVSKLWLPIGLALTAARILRENKKLALI